jgi:uncharacterized repeat protein (TIGR03803 family)
LPVGSSFDIGLLCEYAYSFTGLADGGIPAGGLTEVGGRLYGITSQGGLQNAGTIFRVDP